MTEQKNNIAAKPGLRPFVISRVFDAPRELVWKAWTELDLVQWWGPKGVTVHHGKLALRPGGFFHYCMKTPNGGEMWGKWAFREVAEPVRLVFINSFSNEAGGITRHPMNASWPLEMLSTITFTAQGDQTLLTIKWMPWNCTDEERATFYAGRDSMKGGWTGTLDQLSAYLTTAEVMR